MISIGIDIGLNGAVARGGDSPGVPVIVQPTPLLPGGKHYDEPGMLQLLHDLTTPYPANVHMFIEEPYTNPSPLMRWAGKVLPLQEAQKASSIARAQCALNRNFGMWCGMAVAEGIPYATVRPAVWKKAMLGGLDKKDKASSIIACRRLFPGVDLRRTPRCRVPSHDFAEALLIMAWGLRVLQAV